MSKQRTIVRDVFGAILFSICMTCVTALPYSILIFILSPNPNTDEVLFGIIILIVSFLFFAGLGGLGKLIARSLRGQSPSSEISNNSAENIDETRLMQQLYQCGQRLEERVEALETILLDRASTPHHPVRAEREDS